MKTVVIVQARCGSTRLPGKVLLPLGGRPMLVRMLERLARARTPDAVVVATTTLEEDDAIEGTVTRAGFSCLRGHPTDLLDRHYDAARRTGADVVVKIPSDCPLIDPEVVDRVVTAHLQDAHGPAYTSNLHPESYPDGNDVEAMSIAGLETAWREASRPYEREHTTPFLWDQPARFATKNVLWETGRDLSRSHRVVVDYEEDYALVRTVFDALWTAERPVFGVAEIARFLDHHPEVRRINESRFGATWYRAHASELRTAAREQTRDL
ncbi:MAG TPA: glycosyltransferase family protein [Polyangiaceae bacterium]|jgi:spore coat polysaccharide biosynthesis protein SpsF|nr:glycosyltransferase family protein [Polyangiaceae bacterium]